MFDPYDPTDEFKTDGGETRIEQIPMKGESVVGFNFGLYRREDQDYDLRSSKSLSHGGVSRRSVVHPHHTYGKATHLISEFFDEFPTDIIFLEQAGLWMRWFSGMHFFEDGNHRTGIASLRRAAEANNIEEPPKFDEVDREVTETALDASKAVREDVDVSQEMMFVRDDLYEVWRSYFELVW